MSFEIQGNNYCDFLKKLPNTAENNKGYTTLPEIKTIFKTEDNEYNFDFFEKEEDDENYALPNYDDSDDDAFLINRYVENRPDTPEVQAHDKEFSEKMNEYDAQNPEPALPAYETMEATYKYNKETGKMELVDKHADYTKWKEDREEYLNNLETEYRKTHKDYEKQMEDYENEKRFPQKLVDTLNKTKSNQEKTKLYDDYKDYVSAGMEDWEKENPKPVFNPLTLCLGYPEQYDKQVEKWEANRAEHEKSLQEKFEQENPDFTNVKKEVDKLTATHDTYMQKKEAEYEKNNPKPEFPKNSDNPWTLCIRSYPKDYDKQVKEWQEKKDSYMQGIEDYYKENNPDYAMYQ